MILICDGTYNVFNDYSAALKFLDNKKSNNSVSIFEAEDIEKRPFKELKKLAGIKTISQNTLNEAKEQIQQGIIDNVRSINKKIFVECLANAYDSSEKFAEFFFTINWSSNPLLYFKVFISSIEEIDAMSIKTKDVRTQVNKAAKNLEWNILKIEKDKDGPFLKKDNDYLWDLYHVVLSKEREAIDNE